MSDVPVSIDRFAATMEQILGGVSDEVGAVSAEAVREAAKVGRRETSARAPVRTGRYRAGWSYRVRKSRSGASAEVGNKDVPGLAHLLEKGHARVGGGRVEGVEHIAPAADAAFDALESEVLKGVGSL